MTQPLEVVLMLQNTTQNLAPALELGLVGSTSYILVKELVGQSCRGVSCGVQARTKGRW